MNIIAQLQGGLGNQLFQYATARALAIQKQASLLLDQSWYAQTYEGVTPRNLHLNYLNTLGALISYDPSFQKPKKLRIISQQFWPLNPFMFLEKTPYCFDERLRKSPVFKRQNLYLMGYWQSYKYFEAIKSLLLKEIRPKKIIDLHYQNYLDQIQSSQSAMVHVRRGDYVSSTSAAKIHGFIGLDYYTQGMKILRERNPDTHFFVFSDDADWVAAKLPHQDKCTFIQSSNSHDAVVQELELMTYCQNHLIANSSLSWWAAWLGKNPRGTVICPAKWMSDPKRDFNDLLPAEWQRI